MAANDPVDTFSQGHPTDAHSDAIPLDVLSVGGELIPQPPFGDARHTRRLSGLIRSSDS